MSRTVQVNEKSVILEDGKKRDGIKSREPRRGWMDAYCHGDNNQQAHTLIYYRLVFMFVQVSMFVLVI